MSIRKILIYPDKRLLKKAEPYNSVGPDVARLAADMFETMDSNDGVGLAGPQVGVCKRILVLREPDKDRGMCLINPEFIETEGKEMAEEGCLSLPRLYAPVARFSRIRVRALNEHGRPLEFEATGLLARIIQHETDHLDGKVFLDRVDILTREAKLQEWAELKGPSTAASHEA